MTSDPSSRPCIHLIEDIILIYDAERMLERIRVITQHQLFDLISTSHKKWLKENETRYVGLRKYRKATWKLDPSILEDGLSCLYRMHYRMQDSASYRTLLGIEESIYDLIHACDDADLLIAGLLSLDYNDNVDDSGDWML